MIQWCPSVSAGIGKRHRVRRRDINQVDPERNGKLCISPQRPTHQVSPRPIARRLAAAGACKLSTSSLEQHRWLTAGTLFFVDY